MKIQTCSLIWIFKNLRHFLVCVHSSHKPQNLTRQKTFSTVETVTSIKTILGTFAGFRVQNWTITGLEYLFGDIDGCESHRETFVAIQCGKSDRLIKLEEIDSCSYR